jgi:uncharacterized protein involved in type VI secretion and phage assembly
MGDHRYCGLFRGVVKDNDDSSTSWPYTGRLKIFVPQVYGEGIKDADLPWAEPCLPMGGGRTKINGDEVSCGFVALPPIGSSVWVTFEQGDPSAPVWLGTWYGKQVSHEMPEEAVHDSHVGVDYPEIFLIRPPFRKSGMWIRFSSSKVLEVVFEEGKTHLTFDETTKQIALRADDWDVNVRSETGKVNLSAGMPEQSIVINPLTGEIRITATKLVVNASGEVKVTGKNVRVSAEEGTYNASVRASGWENH